MCEGKILTFIQIKRLNRQRIICVEKCHHSSQMWIVAAPLHSQLLTKIVMVVGRGNYNGGWCGKGSKQTRRPKFRGSFQV